MSLAQAQAAAADLRIALLDNGVRRVSIELQPGVSTSGWGVAPFKRGLGHHIVSRPSQGKTPGLALVKNGRRDLNGPLANGYGGFDLVARILTMGWANHPGLGGPWSVPGWGIIPKDNGRPYIFGWEFEGGLEPYTDEMHDFMARCGAGTLDWIGNAPLTCWDEHKGWAGPRKIDRLGYTTASGRARIAAVRGTTSFTPVIDPRGPDMRVVIAVDTGKMYLAGEHEVSYIDSPEQADALVAVWGQPVQVNQRQVDVASFEANARRAAQRQETADAVRQTLHGDTA